MHPTTTPWSSRLIAALLLLPASVVLAIIWVAVKLSDPTQPAFFRQTRVGINQQPFQCWKVRTLATIVATPPVVPNDARITKLGWYLRRCHVDEIIQLLNIIEGTMVFVGPRPRLPCEDVLSLATIPGYSARHTVLPGLTGLRQVKGRRSPRHTTMFDRFMIERLKSRRFRAWILWQTILRVLRFGGE